MSTGGGYDPHTLEADIYRFWEEGDHFRAVPNPDRKPFVIDIPLPNVTGSLHLGHAINETCQDVLIRYHRMRGFEALWMPGTDHAGIATQAVVERRLKEEQNLTRHELGRDGLVSRIWEWKENYGSRILAQLRKMGFSCDWDRTRFTLDEICAKAVYEVFFQWFKAGLIFRGTRLVNWDTHLQTAVADDEVIHETVKGHFWHYRYPIEGHDASAPEARETIDYVVIATTRPETMLGDTAICVHPDDARYRHLVGKNCVLPLLNRPIPIIADGQLAKMELGTGVVKVTPGHDPRDYECGLRNKLAMLSILTPDGRITEHGGPYAGLSREQCRKQVVADLEALGLMEKVESIEHDVGHSDRSKTPIEPLLSEQWFLRMGDLAELAMEAVRDGRVQFHPQRYAKTLLDWLGEKRDWCISRQLWWGHRIPVWSGDLRLSELLAPSTPQCAALFDRAEYSAILSVADLATGQRWHHLDSENGAGWRALRAELERGDRLVRIMVCAAPGERGEVRHDDAIAWCEERGFQRDPDVLDTWFSSALWPFSTLGWPDNYGRGITEGDPSPTWTTSIPPVCSSPAATSSRSGSRG
ncbi:MAG: class I tRNA ligase family protein [Phycisphaerales bacterium]|nr:class I tRNA ligase family protein [Phycisphaerales bacterium]